MQTTQPIRTPEAILQAMDTNNSRSNPNLLTQLNAELLVSLSIEADKVAAKNLEIADRSVKVAKWSCGVGVIALIVAIISMFK